MSSVGSFGDEDEEPAGQMEEVCAFPRMALDGWRRCRMPILEGMIIFRFTHIVRVFIGLDLGHRTGYWFQEVTMHGRIPHEGFRVDSSTAFLPDRRSDTKLETSLTCAV